MNILWIVNMLLPEVADQLNTQTSASGSWMVDSSKLLANSEHIKLAVACVYGKDFKKIEINNISYYLLPGNGKNMLFYTKKYENFWVKINEEFKPDLVHIHGTEYSHGLAFLRSCPEVKSLVSLQGLLTRIKNVDLGEISLFEYIRNRTFSEFVHFNGPIELHMLNYRNAKYEQEMIRRANYINGINTWDISIAKSINPNASIYKSEYILRDEIYSSPKWNIKDVNRYTIFTNPGGTPLKGIHQLIKAVSILKEKYPGILIKVPGEGIGGKIRVNDSYSKYLACLIKNLNMENNISFIGRQTSAEMSENIRKSNIVVVPSAIEGTSLILREAMYIGTPVIASFRGGMADFVSDKQDGFLYDFSEYTYLAARIEELFDNDELCQKFSENAILKASIAHDKLNNQNAMLEIYKSILN